MNRAEKLLQQKLTFIQNHKGEHPDFLLMTKQQYAELVVSATTVECMAIGTSVIITEDIQDPVFVIA